MTWRIDVVIIEESLQDEVHRLWGKPRPNMGVPTPTHIMVAHGKHPGFGRGKDSDVKPCYFCGLKTPYGCHPKCREKTSSGDLRPFSCHICNGKFKVKRTLEAHLNLHLPDSPFCCDICGKLSTTKSSLNKHRTIHFGEYHQCNICFKIYSRKDLLKIHTISHQSSATRKDFLCEICGYICDCFRLLKEHISNVHSHERKYICEVCGAGTNKINKFKDHMVTHTGDKQFICAVCDKPFGRRGTLKTHIIRCHHKTMGLSKETFPCSLCGKVYQSNNGIIKHMRSHTGERNFVCDLCGKHFMHAFDLSKHKKSSIHNEELAAQQKSKRINKKSSSFLKSCFVVCWSQRALHQTICNNMPAGEDKPLQSVQFFPLETTVS
uniref:C2H2-type domain-containing protein n=1 Tax=Timema genevievae TaxID=629358 RepID=A0A7R9PNK0_TIMGE|nr:unnamed protein product [Timema genevievae]